MNLSKGAALVGLLVLLLLTYFRENFLLEINANLAMETHDRAYSYWFSSFFKDMSTQLLTQWKWGITMFFSVIMTFVTTLSLYLWFKSKQFLKITILFYIILFAVVCILALFGFLTSSFNNVYFVLRKILGAVQSPLPFFVFFVLFYWNVKTEK